MANADLEAYNVMKQHPQYSDAERQYAVAVARGEGFFGRGWGTPSQRTIELSKKVGLTGFEGKDSHNWGAEQGKGDLGSFPHIDFHADGSMYVGQYAKYSNDLASSARFARILLKDNVRAALARGSLRDAVFAQHSNRYFELAPEKYLEAVLRNYEKASVNTGWTRLLSEHGNGGIDTDPLVPYPNGPPEAGPPGWLLDYMRSEGISPKDG